MSQQPNEPTVDDRYVRRVVIATMVVFAANGGLFATWVSRLPAVRDDLGASERELGFALLFTAVGSLLAMPLSGRLVNAVGARKVMAGCVIVCCSSYPLLGLAPNLIVLSVVLFVLGAGVGVWDVSMNVSAQVVEARAGRTLMPGFHAGWSIGTVTGAGIGALAAHYGVSPAAHFGLICLVVGVVSIVLLQVMPDGRDESHDDVVETGGEHHVAVRPRPLILDPRLLGLGVMVFCAAWAEGAANDWLAIMLTDTRDASGATAALGFAIFAAGMTAARAAGNKIVDAFGRVRTLRIGAGVTAVGLVIVLTVPWLGAAYFGALLWGLGIAIAFPLGMSAAGETPGRGPSAIATVATIAYSGFLIGPPLIGTLAHEVGLDDALWVVLVLAAGILLLAGNARDPRISRPSTTDERVQG